MEEKINENDENNQNKENKNEENNEENRKQEIKSEVNNNIEIKENIPLDTEEDEINKEDIKDIVDYLSNLDYEKYSRDMEIKEALMILKSKMDKIQEQKEKEEEIQNEKIRVIEDNNLTIYNKNINEKQNENKEEKNEQRNIYMNKKEEINNINHEIKEPKEIVDEEEVKKKEKIEKYKLAEKIAKSSALKDVHSVQSVQKLLLRENIDDQAPLRITIIKESPLACCDDYIPNKLPFLRSLPIV